MLSLVCRLEDSYAWSYSVDMCVAWDREVRSRTEVKRVLCHAETLERSALTLCAGWKMTMVIWC